jgi:penicillin-binding protein 1C
MKFRFFELRYLVLTLAFFATLVGLGRLTSSPLVERFGSSRAVWSSDGKLLRLTLSSDQTYRLWTSLKNIPEKVIKTFLWNEDQYFYYHPGFNFYSLIRAAYATYFLKTRRIGASTLTMQLARRLYDINTQTPVGKLRQILSAIWLEMIYSKNEILEAHLNLCPMGGNIEGVAAASLIFFAKPVQEVSWAEALAYAVIPQNPNNRSFLKKSNIELEPARQSLLRRNWDKLSVQERDIALVKVLPLKELNLPFLAPHFVGEALKRSGTGEKLETTLDSELQKDFEKKLRSYLSVASRVGVSNGAMILTDWTQQKVLAWVGSADFFNEKIQGQVDGVTALRSPGSALKPLIYALALDQGLIHPGTILKDSPMSFGSYDPENFDNDFHGPISAEVALNQSRNIPAVYLVSQLGNNGKIDFYEFLLRAQVGVPKSREHYGYSLALGGFEISLLDLVQLYGALARDGTRTRFKIFESDTHKDKNVSILTPESSFIVLDMMSRNFIDPSRYGRWAQQYSIPLSWKTGTSAGFRDAWCVAVIGPYVLGVWLGNFSGQANPALVGREMAAPLVFELVDLLKARGRINHHRLPVRLGSLKIKDVEVCPISGKIPGPHCRNLKKIKFISEVSPIHECDVHREIFVNKKTGLQSCLRDMSIVEKRVIEVWPTDILKIFAEARMARRVAPPFDESCHEESQVTREVVALGGVMISPKEGVVYSVRSSFDLKNQIPFQASFQGDSEQEVFWFVDHEYVGQSHGAGVFLWPAKPGRFQVKALNKKGQSLNRKIQVQVVE